MIRYGLVFISQMSNIFIANFFIYLLVNWLIIIRIFKEQ